MLGTTAEVTLHLLIHSGWGNPSGSVSSWLEADAAVVSQNLCRWMGATEWTPQWRMLCDENSLQFLPWATIVYHVQHFSDSISKYVFLLTIRLKQ